MCLRFSAAWQLNSLSAGLYADCRYGAVSGGAQSQFGQSGCAPHDYWSYVQSTRTSSSSPSASAAYYSITASVFHFHRPTTGSIDSLRLGSESLSDVLVRLPLTSASIALTPDLIASWVSWSLLLSFASHPPTQWSSSPSLFTSLHSKKRALATRCCFFGELRWHTLATPWPLLVTRHQLSIRRIAARICFCALDDSTMASLLA